MKVKVVTIVKYVFADPDELKSVSVTEGESVTLQTNVTELRNKTLITWTFGHSLTRIAQINKEDGIFSTSEGDAVGFRDRLKLDNQTGSLIITNTRTTDSGNYTVNIKETTKPITYSFNLTVCGRDQTGNEEITYAEATFYKQKGRKPGAKKEDEVVYADVVTRNGSNP
ncbi:hypothetical protein cypCar_00045013 [Cyprinus carpio]|nr:hypothetical protein cypCar_00045013 [Cyprinus carpio]